VRFRLEGQHVDTRDVNTVDVNRVVVLGRGGAGKSVFARDLGRAAALPVVELDKELWSVQLEPMAVHIWRERQRTLAHEGRWIMDGDLGPYDDLEPRLRRADTVVVLDMPLWLCAWRALRRGRERRDFWSWMLRWRRESRPQLMAAIASYAADANVVVLRGRSAVRRWLAAP
jgi:adenylate kinase family enzyme